MPASRSLGVRVAVAVTSVGLAIAVTGTFLPWFHSGQVERSSYQAVGFVDHFELLSSPFAVVVLRSWLGVPLLAAVCVGLLALGFRRLGATITALLAIVVGTVSALAAVQAAGGDGIVGVTSLGPVTTTTGMTIALLGAFGVLGASWRGRRSAKTGRAGVQP